MRRILFGIALLLHGIAHANAGMLATDDRNLIATGLWAIASVGFLAAGFGLIGVRQLYLHWQVLGMTAAASSIQWCGWISLESRLKRIRASMSAIFRSTGSSASRSCA